MYIFKCCIDVERERERDTHKNTLAHTYTTCLQPEHDQIICDDDDDDDAQPGAALLKSGFIWS